ncbi:MAG: DUF1801 domain-containing protein [Mesorhizobium sp.]|nr:DUF1801 domain-containing protein [Mesorhizobium sp.]
MPDTETTPTFDNADVATTFDGYPHPSQDKLLDLRRLIFDTAAETAGVGHIEETLKWGQPSYLTPQTRSGSTIRIDAIKDDPQRFAMYFHCQTDLAATFRRLYPNSFAFEGNRAIHFCASDALPEDELKHCIALALTYHSRKKA